MGCVVVERQLEMGQPTKKDFLQIHNFVKGYQMLPMTKWLQLWPKKDSDLPPNFTTKETN